MEEEQEAARGAAWDCGSPLYDSFEVARLHHVLESNLMILPPFPPDDDDDAAAQRIMLDDGRRAAEVDDANGAAARKSGGRRRKRRTAGWKAAAAIYRAVACWRRPCLPLLSIPPFSLPYKARKRAIGSGWSQIQLPHKRYINAT
ncbi:hypothetical protein [Oryza sativa Japonica Group]|uniref:Uncharacterized protein n=1 Tax=Oryza sativa subsp. japonica TaxID=39947 RepID=Q5SN04_ORYSJ|nr:hypothetical protein [Oryza sativa Japonica Group]BAD72400.1 hypothetical protein [Oryza sativa Japonica Group]